MEHIVWCAVGDSFTYLNDHLDETGNRVSSGYLTRTVEKLSVPVRYVNLGKNGSSTSDWLERELIRADIYTVLLGTNDWYLHHTPVGTAEDFLNRRTGTILGNLGQIIGNIRKLAPQAPVIVMNPVERGDFVYLADYWNNAHGSYAEEGCQWLRDVAHTIFASVSGDRIYPVDLHDRSGFSPENVVAFKRVKTSDRVEDLPYPAYVGIAYDPERDPYPYPEEAANLTYDGLHPSDKGNEIIAEILAGEMERVLRETILK